MSYLVDVFQNALSMLVLQVLSKLASSLIDRPLWEAAMADVLACGLLPGRPNFSVDRGGGARKGADATSGVPCVGSGASHSQLGLSYPPVDVDFAGAEPRPSVLLVDD